MIKSENIKNYIETELNIIAYDLGYKDIVFNGKVDFYDHDWIKQNFSLYEEGKKITPFVLTTNLMQRSRETDAIVDFRYTLVAIPYEDDREKIREIYHKLNEKLSRTKIDDYNIVFTPSNVGFGADFSEGSGLGYRRFEALFEFEGQAGTTVGYEDIELSFGSLNIPIVSFKYEQSKINILNKSNDYVGELQHNINSDLLVVETIIDKENGALTDLLNQKQKVNIENTVLLKVDDIEVINDDYMFENYSLVFSRELDRLVAYLYFSRSFDRATITIGGDTIPVISYAISMAVSTDTHISPNSNTIKNIFLGKARSYSFTIVEEFNTYGVIDSFLTELIEDGENNPMYQVDIKVGSETHSKRLLLTDVVKDSEESANGFITIKFLDGSDL